MSAPYPALLPQAFAGSANPINRNTIPAAPLTAQRASYDLGFPPQTMTPIVAGGKPMLGPDMNGILYAISSHTFYAQTGQAYRFDATIAGLIAGYAAGTVLGSTDGTTLWFNLVNGNVTDPDDNATAVGWAPMYSYGFSLLPPTTGGVVTLTPSQASKGVIVVSGALIANSQLIIPAQLRRWLIVNTTSGGFSLTVKTLAGTGIQVPQGGYAAPTEVYCNGVNVYNVIAPITLPTSVAATPNTIPLRSNLGYVYATYFNQSSLLENFTITEVYAGAGDGFLRKINKVNFAANFPINTFSGVVANAQVPAAAVTQHKAAVLASAILTGVPVTPTPAAGDSSTKIASTAFIDAAISAIFGNSNVVVKWGTVAYGADNDKRTVNIVFGSAFPNACAGLFLTVLTNSNVFGQVVSKTVAGAVTEVCQRENGGGFNAGTLMYLAVGT